VNAVQALAASPLFTASPGGTPTREAAEVMRRFPPRPAGHRWPESSQPREQVLARLLAPPFPLANGAGQRQRRWGMMRMLDWLGSQPGCTWQQRWAASGAEDAGQWRQLPARWLASTGRISASSQRPESGLGGGLLLLICGDVIRPGLPWLLASSGLQNLTTEMARIRDPDSFAGLRRLCDAEQASTVTRDLSLRRIAAIMAAKGGAVSDITAGDCLELARAAGQVGGSRATGMYFYQLLRGTGVFPQQAPATMRMFTTQGQLSAGQLIDRCGIACRPVRDLLVAYLSEQQLMVDHASLRAMAHVLGNLFWRDLERHHPGIDSLRLAPEAAAGWKQRIQLKTRRSTTSAGDVIETHAPRSAAASALFTVRAFYLDIAQWAVDDPARWAAWAAPCPIRDGEVPYRKEFSRRKARMDQRTRERLPALPVLAAAADDERHASARRLSAAQAAAPGEVFTAAGQDLRRPVMTSRASARIWADDPATGKRRDLTLEEHRGFWSWAAIEVLRHSGIRIEELTELSHHSVVQYRLPATGELIPLLQIAPSKTDTERLLVISPELADVLSAIISRIRDEGGAIPLVVSYDDNERLWNPPMPLLFQRRLRAENRPITAQAIRQLLDIALARTGLTDASGLPLRFAPHDFRRLLITDAIMHGMPPHIAQLVAGHRDINTTMGYKAVYPEEVINGHRAFIARRRALRPSEEYRTPTDAEWEEFLGHFERRRVALGDCGRAYATSCIHEHSCIRCPLLRVDTAQRPRLAGIRDNLIARISEARQQGWAGEAEGLEVSLAAANAKLAQLDGLIARRTAAIGLGLPAFGDIAGRAIAAQEPTRPHPTRLHDRLVQRRAAPAGLLV
jgi:Phage integrase family